MPTRAEDVAKQLRAWAASKGVLTYTPADDEPEEPLDFEEVTTEAKAQATENVLNIRRINLVCVDDEQNKVIVYTQKAPTKKEREDLPSTLDGDVKIEFRKGSLPIIRNALVSGSAAGCSALHKGKYTCGSSVFVGNRIGAGTLGCLVKDASGKLLGLSNNHVTGGMSFSEVDLPITAPGTADVCAGAADPFTLGHHRKALSITLGSPDNADVSKNLDAAVFAVKDADLVSSMQRTHFDTPRDVMAPKPNIVVEKVGRTTGLTRGTIVGRAIAPEPVMVKIPEFNMSSVIYFEDFWIVECLNQQEFSRPGDSGSLICFRPSQGQPYAMGLLFAANTSKSLTYIAPLDKILANLGVTLVSGHNT